jgi:hypothetical protein
MKKISKMHERLNTAKQERAALGADDSINEKNTIWDDARNIYETSVLAIERANGQLASFLTDVVNSPEKLKLIKDPVMLKNNIDLLSRDIPDHRQRLDAIYAQHSDKTGGSTEPDEHMLGLNIYEQYRGAIELYDAVIMPTISHIFEQVGAAEELVIASALEKQQATVTALQDPSIISDIPVKEIVNHE